jgi:hypothetical protein
LVHDGGWYRKYIVQPDPAGSRITHQVFRRTGWRLPLAN